MARLRLLSTLALILISLGGFAYYQFRARVAIAAPRATGPDFLVSGKDLPLPLKIIVYGDMRFTDPNETSATNPKVRRWLVEQIASEKPDAVLLSGDVPWRGGHSNDYAVFRSETQSWRDQRLHIFPALGNHELKDGDEKQCLENWWNSFPELRGLRYYSAQLGDSVYVLNLDSDLALTPGSDQIFWVKSQLATLTSTVRFVIFNMHHPPVVDIQKDGDDSHNGRPNEAAFREFLGNEKRPRVRFVVEAGHIHNYERFLQDGVVYVVSGGGGAKPRPIERQPKDLYQDRAFPNYHYVKLVLNGTQLGGTMIRLADPEAAAPQWDEKDHFEVLAQ